MNNERRKQIAAAVAAIGAARDKLEQAAADEQNAFDNLPEAIQDSERGQKMDENANEILDAAAEIGEALSQIEYAAE
jgi:hypothetical protein